MLDFCGIERARLRARWVSSAEAPEFVEEMNSFIEALKILGPSPLKAKTVKNEVGKIETDKIGVS